MIVAVGSVELS